MRKGVLIAIVLVLAVFVGGIAIIYSSIGSVISDTIASRGSAITQTEVSVSEADYSTASGMATIKQFRIKNPSAFISPYALTVDQVDMWLEPSSLSDNPLQVNLIKFTAPEIVYEIHDNTDNLRTLKRHIEKSISKLTGASDGKRIKVERFVFENGTVAVVSENMSGAKRTARLNNFEIENLGGALGLTPEEISKAILLKILRETTIAALNTDLPLTDQARNVLNGAVDETENAIKLLKDILK